VSRVSQVLLDMHQHLCVHLNSSRSRILYLLAMIPAVCPRTEIASAAVDCVCHCYRLSCSVNTCVSSRHVTPSSISCRIHSVTHCLPVYPPCIVIVWSVSQSVGQSGVRSNVERLQTTHKPVSDLSQLPATDRRMDRRTLLV